MKRVFISVPMTGRDEADILKDMEKGMKEYCKKHPGETVQFVHNYSKEEPPPEYKRPELFYMGMAIQKMGTCDEVTYYGDVGSSKGCQVEMLTDLLYFSRDKQPS